MANLSLQDQTTEFLLYTAPNGAVKVEVLLSGETLWLTRSAWPSCLVWVFLLYPNT